MEFCNIYFVSFFTLVKRFVVKPYSNFHKDYCSNSNALNEASYTDSSTSLDLLSKSDKSFYFVQEFGAKNEPLVSEQLETLLEVKNHEKGLLGFSGNFSAFLTFITPHWFRTFSCVVVLAENKKRNVLAN